MREVIVDHLEVFKVNEGDVVMMTSDATNCTSIA